MSTIGYLLGWAPEHYGEPVNERVWRQVARFREEPLRHMSEISMALHPYTGTGMHSNWFDLDDASLMVICLYGAYHTQMPQYEPGTKAKRLPTCLRLLSEHIARTGGHKAPTTPRMIERHYEILFSIQNDPELFYRNLHGVIRRYGLNCRESKFSNAPAIRWSALENDIRDMLAGGEKREAVTLEWGRLFWAPESPPHGREHANADEEEGGPEAEAR